MLNFWWKDELSNIDIDVSLVDWKQFWFHKDNGGMAEWMLDNGHRGKPEENEKGWYMFEGRKRMAGHPTAEAHKDFCEQIIKPWIKQ